MPRLGSTRAHRSCRFTLSKFPRPHQVVHLTAKKLAIDLPNTVVETYDQAQCRSYLAHRPIILGVFHAQRTAHFTRGLDPSSCSMQGFEKQERAFLGK